MRKKKSGLFIYTLPDTEIVIYVGKVKSLYVRLKCHFDESIFTEKDNIRGLHGKSKKVLYPALFRDHHKGLVKIFWIEVEEEHERKITEKIFHFILKPKFIDLKKEFNEKITR